MSLLATRLILGSLLLFFGHRLFWLFAAIAGFLFGIQLAAGWGASWPQWIQILLAIGAGLAMAALAVLSVRLAGMVVGFLAAWVLVGEILNTLGIDAGALNLFALMVGGIIGALLALVFFDVALVILSSLVGASTIVTAFSEITGLAGQNLLLLVLGVVLAVIGIIFQWRELDRNDRVVVE